MAVVSMSVDFVVREHPTSKNPFSVGNTLSDYVDTSSVSLGACPCSTLVSRSFQKVIAYSTGSYVNLSQHA